MDRLPFASEGYIDDISNTTHDKTPTSDIETLDLDIPIAYP